MACNQGVRLTIQFIRIRRKLDLLVSAQNIDACCRKESNISLETSGSGRRAPEEVGKQKVLHPYIRDGC